MNTRRVAVTGAGGFIGRALVARLAENGRALRLHAGPPGAPGPADAARFAIDDAAAVRAFVRSVDCVVHLAGHPDIRASVNAPQACLRAHVTGTALVAAAAAECGAALVYVSSAAARAPEAGERPVRPTTPYAAAKRAGEAIVRAYAGVVPVLILRPANVYGVGAHRETLIAELCRAAAFGAPVAARVPSAPVEPIHVDDVAAALAQAVDRVASLASGDCLELGPGGVLTAGDVAARVARLARAPDEEAPEPSPIGTEALRARRALGWTPTVTLDAGLRALVRAERTGSGPAGLDVDTQV